MKRELRQAVALYESFREARPRKLGKVRFDVPKVVAVIGHVEGIDYRTTHGKKVTLYHHDFAPGSRPLLCTSSDGKQLLLLGGRYHFTERGIVDKDHKGDERPDPKHGRYVNPRGGKYLDQLRADPRIDSIDDERGYGEGIWVYLKPGYRAPDDSASDRTIHEDTIAAVRRMVSRIVPDEPEEQDA